MHTALAATPTPAPCSTGDWAQKFACGWHQPTTGAAHLGTTAGHGFGGLVIAAVVVLILMGIVKAAKGSRTPAPSKS